MNSVGRNIRNEQDGLPCIVSCQGNTHEERVVPSSCSAALTPPADPACAAGWLPCRQPLQRPPQDEDGVSGQPPQGRQPPQECRQVIGARTCAANEARKAHKCLLFRTSILHSQYDCHSLTCRIPKASTLPLQYAHCPRLLPLLPVERDRPAATLRVSEPA